MKKEKEKEKEIKILDFFAGIGGIRKGISSAINENGDSVRFLGFSDIKKEAIISYNELYPNEVNFGDITKINTKELPDFDLFLGGFPCFISGTKVLTIDGYKNIEDIKPGEKVLTHNNRYKEVTKIMNKIYTGDIFSIRGQSTIDTFTTPNHPFFTYGNQWINASDLDEDEHKLGVIKNNEIIFENINRINKKYKSKITVYNLEVEEDNSYTANNLVVHNCQSYSMAGKRKGLKDERGQLIFNVFDIVEDKKPKYLFLENVAGLTTINEGKDIKNILSELDEIGYYCDFVLFNSKNIGIPQSRQRAYFFGIYKKDIQKEQFEKIIKEIKEEIKNKKEVKNIYEILEDRNIKELEHLYLKDKEAKMTTLRDNFCGSLKGIDSISNGVTKTYGKISGQSTKVIYNTKEDRYLNQIEVDELYSLYKEKSKELKAIKKELKEKKSDRLERNNVLENFFKTFELPKEYIFRMFSSKELGRLQGFSDKDIDIVINTLKTHKGCSSVFGDSVTVSVVKYLYGLFYSKIKNI